MLFAPVYPVNVLIFRTQASVENIEICTHSHSLSLYHICVCVCVRPANGICISWITEFWSICIEVSLNLHIKHKFCSEKKEERQHHHQNTNNTGSMPVFLLIRPKITCAQVYRPMQNIWMRINKNVLNYFALGLLEMCSSIYIYEIIPFVCF